MVQVTPPLFGSPLTAAVNGCVPPDCTEADCGEIETVIPGIVMMAEPVAAAFVWDAAVSVTVKFPAGGAVGAV
jgi:hypothetical protein